jgi:hypothetical protein
MRKFLTPLLFFSFCLSFGQKVISKKYESNDIKDIRDVKIYLPKGYNKDTVSNFPLTIVLEEEKLFDLYVGVSNFYAAQDQAPEQIIVGVNLEATRENDMGYDLASSKLNASARRFYTFLRDELIPFVEANYKTSPFLTIVGEGLSANFITYFLQENNPIFNAYISLNATYAPDIRTLVQSFKLEKMAPLDNSFYYYISGNPHAGGEKSKRIQEFGKFMKSTDIENFSVAFDELTSSTSASSTIGEGMSRAFAHVFKDYLGITEEEFEKNIKDLDPPSAISYLEIKYLDIEYLFGSNIGVRKRDADRILKIVTEKEEGSYTKPFAEMILKLNPYSPMGNIYLAEWYESTENKSAALKQYKEAYDKMNPDDPNTLVFYQDTIERLGGIQDDNNDNDPEKN